ncbi:hypothetical protein CAPTEDRAFT_187764 [Capitella teleta]|uniref:THD domain-containing protein n=1 Tax=Capitella teleta TaxID=283909 RepID=R7UXA2_CAPTE|nr:hypothetical protein CAPTEDRAFT_187764 [Capitella teleta]|eukprot:ELU08031.1 hypothetical protein CAPTEDRAFT_187764 [Capitella teleta]
MACTIGRLSLVLASVAFSVVHSMVLPPGEYDISTRGSEQDHCQSCIELMTLLTNKSHEVNLEELEEKFGEIDDSGNLLCCVKTPSQIMSLIRIGLRNISHTRGPYQAQQRFSFQKFINNSALVRPRHHKRGFKRISPSEWSSDASSSDLAFCDPGTTNLCNNSHHSNAIVIPFTGAYTINCRAAWKSPPKQPFTERFALEFSRVIQNGSVEQILAHESVQAECSPHRHPCAAVQVLQKLRLSQGDRVFISVKHKDLLYARPEHTFFGLTGESFP